MLSSLFGDSASVELFLALFIAIIFSITLHEYAHAFVATKQGDLTPKAYGRLTLNPIKHFDPLGFLCMMLFGFGWAKPVPVNPLKFKHYKRGIISVSIAGVVVNIILCVVFSFLYALCSKYFAGTTFSSRFLIYLCLCFSSINLFLAIFNFLPIYPLDGFNFVSAFAKYDSKFIVFMRNYGNIILILLLVTPALDYLLGYADKYILQNLYKLFTNILGGA